MGIFNILIIVLIGAVITYILARYVTLRLAIILWLAVVLFGASLFFIPPVQAVPTGQTDSAAGMGQALAFVFLAVPAFVGSTLGLFAGWIVIRMRETAV